MRFSSVILGLFFLLGMTLVVLGQCPRGMPHPRATCGRGGVIQRCPSGYYCSVGQARRFGLCCPGTVVGPCGRGRPVANTSCRNGRGCPYGYRCTQNIESKMAVCCSDNHTYPR